MCALRATAPASAPGAQAGGKPFSYRASRRSLACSSAVFWSWWYLQRLCRFSGSVNRSHSPRCGWMWSTTVAVVRFPSEAQILQNGSLTS